MRMLAHALLCQCASLVIIIFYSTVLPTNSRLQLKAYSIFEVAAERRSCSLYLLHMQAYSPEFIMPHRRRGGGIKRCRDSSVRLSVRLSVPPGQLGAQRHQSCADCGSVYARTPRSAGGISSRRSITCFTVSYARLCQRRTVPHCGRASYLLPIIVVS